MNNIKTEYSFLFFCFLSGLGACGGRLASCLFYSIDGAGDDEESEKRSPFVLYGKTWGIQPAGFKTLVTLFNWLMLSHSHYFISIRTYTQKNLNLKLYKFYTIGYSRPNNTYANLLTNLIKCQNIEESLKNVITSGRALRHKNVQYSSISCLTLS